MGKRNAEKVKTFLETYKKQIDIYKTAPEEFDQLNLGLLWLSKKTQDSSLVLHTEHFDDALKVLNKLHDDLVSANENLIAYLELNERFKKYLPDNIADKDIAAPLKFYDEIHEFYEWCTDTIQALSSITALRRVDLIDKYVILWAENIHWKVMNRSASVYEHGYFIEAIKEAYESCGITLSELAVKSRVQSFRRAEEGKYLKGFKKFNEKSPEGQEHRDSINRFQKALVETIHTKILPKGS